MLVSLSDLGNAISDLADADLRKSATAIVLTAVRADATRRLNKRMEDATLQLRRTGGRFSAPSVPLPMNRSGQIDA